MSRPWLKAGLIGAGILILLNLLNVIPVPLLGCLVFLLEIATFVVVGVLAARWLPAGTLGNRAAGEGALAGLLSGVLGAVVSTLLAPLGLAFSGGTNSILSQLPPESLQQLEQAGVDPSALFGAGTMMGITAFCCIPLGALAGAGLGALGGLIYGAMNPPPAQPPALPDNSLPPDAGSGAGI